ncbi:MAG: alanine/ornithine racemase family PLP-dependent enzyme [bacterium]|nr:alanine/ornithine racemase family PLP-dependent enzyme [bacterium]
MAVLTIDLNKLEHNARIIVQKAAEANIDIYGVTKVLCGEPCVATAMLRAGVKGIADSRIENLRELRNSGIAAPLMMLRLPAISEAEEVVRQADISLNSEYATCVALSKFAVALRRVHKVILMIDIGDLREGIWPKDFPALLEKTVLLPNLEVMGVGANFSCFGGVIPDHANLSVLSSLANHLSRRLGKKTELSAGNSSSLSLLFDQQLPPEATNLRIGEGIILGRETINRIPIVGAYLDVCTLTAEVIEVQDKPSVPIGTIGQDAFGNVPRFENKGTQKRAILSIGRQDVVPEGIVPRLKGLAILGASSDHLILDITEAKQPIVVGDTLSFDVGYGALLAASTSKYVKKEYI